MTDRLELRGMRFEGRHGVLPAERATPQPFEADVVLQLDLRRAGATDALDATIDYATVFRAVEAVITGSHVDLIEALAERIAARVLAEHAIVESVTVRVRKPDAPLPGVFAWAGVEIVRGR